MLVVMAMCSPLAGYALDRIGARLVNVAGLTIITLAMLLTAA